jgi:hypothetical protein
MDRLLSYGIQYNTWFFICQVLHLGFYSLYMEIAVSQSELLKQRRNEGKYDRNNISAYSPIL